MTDTDEIITKLQQTVEDLSAKVAVLEAQIAEIPPDTHDGGATHFFQTDHDERVRVTYDKEARYLGSEADDGALQAGKGIDYTLADDGNAVDLRHHDYTGGSGTPASAAEGAAQADVLIGVQVDNADGDGTGLGHVVAVDTMNGDDRWLVTPDGSDDAEHDSVEYREDGLLQLWDFDGRHLDHNARYKTPFTDLDSTDRYIDYRYQDTIESGIDGSAYVITQIAVVKASGMVTDVYWKGRTITIANAALNIGAEDGSWQGPAGGTS